VHFFGEISVSLVGVIGALIALGAFVYAGLARELVRGGGKVSAREFGTPDLFLGSFFVIFFGAFIAKGFAASDPRPVTKDDLLNGAVMYVAVICVIVFFLRYRGIKPSKQFGLFRLGILKTGALALGFLFAAYPLVMLAGKLTESALGSNAKEQELVRFFRTASEHSQRGAVLATIVVGAVLAPIAEELIFRGYLYGVLKRYLGIFPAIFCSAAIFAAAHLNVTSLPALFVLALCFSLAYEATGSLLVTMSMHGLFNLSMFLLLLNLPPAP